MQILIEEFLTSIIGLLYKIFKLVVETFTRQRRLKRVLSLKKLESALIIPLRQGRLEDYNADYKFATSQEMIASLNILKLLSVAGYPACAKYEEVVFGNKSYSKMALRDKMQYNYFSVGGPYGNTFACYILRKYFPNFQMSCGKSVYENCSKYEDASFYSIQENEMYFLKYKDENQNSKYIYYNKEYKSDYIVLIKMTEFDFKCKGHGTIHLMWGGRADVTEAASTVYLQYEREIYKRLKKHKKHYFIVCEYCKEFGLNFDKWYDLTDIMFNDKKKIKEEN